MKLISWNVNGIRSIIKKGNLVELVNAENPDIICLQEVRATPNQIKLPEIFEEYQYKYYNNPTEKKGYSGTGVFSKIEPEAIIYGIGIPEHDQEGRVITLGFMEYYLVNVYVPNSKSDLSRLGYRVDEWDSSFRNFVNTLSLEKGVIVCGDFNSIHNNIDIHNTRNINRYAGATPEERKSFEKYLETFVDSFRSMNPEKVKYSWWSNFGKCREFNRGWRIDYILVSKLNILNADILDNITGSDHAPCLLEY